MATIFESDNGGATSPGVSATEIRVAVAVRPGVPTATSGTQLAYRETLNALFEHFNRHFELYGRKLVPVLVPGSAQTALNSRAFGADVASRGVFASVLGDVELDYLQVGFVQELARNGVVTVARNGGSWWTDRQVFDAFHPYVWSVYPSAETNLANLADFACTTLKDHPAVHALDPNLRTKPRRFAVLSVGNETPPQASILTQALTECDQGPVRAQWSVITDGSGAPRTVMNQLMAEGVTTVICVCEGVNGLGAVQTARGIGFHPEWVYGPTGYFADEWAGQQPDRVAAYMKVDLQRALPLQQRPWFGAVLEVNPTLLTTTADSLRGSYTMAEYLYSELLVLASGIQGAGPALDADSFASALMTMEFPNPGAGQAPFFQPSVGFHPGDHAFYDDYNVAWWSDMADAVDPYSPRPKGSWCYLDQGTRFRVGTYPGDGDGRLFSPDVPCR